MLLALELPLEVRVPGTSRVRQRDHIPRPGHNKSHCEFGCARGCYPVPTHTYMYMQAGRRPRGRRAAFTAPRGRSKKISRACARRSSR